MPQESIVAVPGMHVKVLGWGRFRNFIMPGRMKGQPIYIDQSVIFHGKPIALSKRLLIITWVYISVIITAIYINTSLV